MDFDIGKRLEAEAPGVGIRGGEAEVVDVCDEGLPYVFLRGCTTTIKAVRRRQLKLPSWEGGFLG